MKIVYKDMLNIHSRAKIKSRDNVHSIPNACPPSTSANFDFSSLNRYQERPLKTNSLNLSFKGLSSIKSSFFVEKITNEFGSSVGRELKNKLSHFSSKKNFDIFVEGEDIHLKNKSFSNNVLEIVSYPFMKLPLDLGNALLGSLLKIKPLKNSKVLNKIFNSNAMKNRREHLELVSDAASVKNLLKLVEDTGAENKINMLKSMHKGFDISKRANYNNINERTLTRLVTGSLPAFFLANDAYNLSLYIHDDKKNAKTDKKRRFNQELARVGVTAGATFAALSLFAKSSNSHANVATAIITAVTFLSEFAGRLMVHTPVLPVDKKLAEKYAIKQGKVTEDEVAEDSKKIEAFSGKSDKSYEKPPKNGSLTMKNVLKVIGVLTVAGFAVDKVTGIKSIKKALSSLNNEYKNLYTKEYTVKKADLTELIEKLEKNGFEKIAKKYQSTLDTILEEGNLTFKERAILKEKISDFENSNPNKKADKKAILKELAFPKKTANADINLGSVEDKLRHSVIHGILAFPVRFAWDTVMTPYKFLKKLFTKKTQKSPASDLDDLKKGVQLLKKQVKSSEDFIKQVNKIIFNTFDNETRSNFSSADNSASVKIATSAVTSGFLIADNYNQVMIDTKGNDKELASQKAKERTIQRGVRILYGAFIIKLFNGVFRNTYNNSMLGAQAVNIGNTAVIESLERKSVGLPIGESTKQNVIDSEKENLEATGVKGSYFRAMAKLTGKKSLAEEKARVMAKS